MDIQPIVLLVLVVLCIQGVVWLMIALWMKRRLEAVRRRMHEQYRGRGFRIQPMPALYRGADARFGNVKGNGVICLTEDALIFEKITGEKMILDRRDIVEASVADVFKGKPSLATGGRHLVLRMKDGNRIGFLVRNAAFWTAKIGLS